MKLLERLAPNPLIKDLINERNKYQPTSNPQLQQPLIDFSMLFFRRFDTLISCFNYTPIIWCIGGYIDRREYRFNFKSLDNYSNLPNIFGYSLNRYLELYRLYDEEILKRFKYQIGRGYTHTTVYLDGVTLKLDERPDYKSYYGYRYF